MLAPMALALVTLASGHPIPSELWVAPQDSFAHAAVFRVRADLHTKDAAIAATLKADVEKQIEATLRSARIPFTTEERGGTPHVDDSADLIIDVHVVEAERATAVAWSFHVSQPAHLQYGQWAFAATWIVGDLIYGPADTTRQRLRDSLQPAVDEFCAAYLAARRRVSPEPPPQPAPSPRVPSNGQL